MEKFFEAGTLTQEELVVGLRAAVGAAKLFPLIVTSALQNIGIPDLLDAIVAYLPSAADRPVTGVNAKTGEEVTKAASDTGPYATFVWKTIADPFAGRITMFRVMLGTVKSDQTVHNLTKDSPDAGQRLSPAGKNANGRADSRPGIWDPSRNEGC